MQIFSIDLTCREMATMQNPTVEKYSIKCNNREIAIVLAVAKWLRLDDNTHIDAVGLKEESETTESEIQEYFEQLGLGNDEITPGAEGQPYEMAVTLIEGDDLSFIYGDFQVEVTRIETTDNLHEVIMLETLKELYKDGRFKNSTISSDEIHIFHPDSLIDIGLEINRDKLAVYIDLNQRQLLGELDIANPNFPKNVPYAISGLISNFVRNDFLLRIGLEHGF